MLSSGRKSTIFLLSLAEIRIRRRLRFGAYKYIIVGEPNMFAVCVCVCSFVWRVIKVENGLFLSASMCFVLFVIQISHLLFECDNSNNHYIECRTKFVTKAMNRIEKRGRRRLDGTEKQTNKHKRLLKCPHGNCFTFNTIYFFRGHSFTSLKS